MKRERRKRYPRDWEKLARQCKEKAGWKCEFCRAKENARRKSKRKGTWYRVHLHAAHRDHDIGNPAPHLLCLCPKCHGRYDYEYRLSLQETDAERLKHRILLSTQR